MISENPIDREPTPTQAEGAPPGANDDREPRQSVANMPPESQPATSEALEHRVGEQEAPQPIVIDSAVWAVHAEQLQAVLNLSEQCQARLHSVDGTIGEMKRSQELHAAKLRELSDKLDDITTSLSEPRIREVLTSLLLIHDLLDQMAGVAADTEPRSDHSRNYGVVLSQILQILTLHGIETIPTDIPFDEGLHRAMRQGKTDDPCEDGRIVEVFRKGFTSKRQVLRYAEVKVLVASPTVDTVGDGPVE